MERERELIQAVREEREAEKRLAACRRRVDELVGISDRLEQRRRKPSKSGSMASAVGL